MGKKLEIILEDDHLLVLNKPAGVLTVPGRNGGASLREVIAALTGCEADLRIVHRLDRETSGVLIMAKTVEAQRGLSKQFESRTVEKQYVAIVQGTPSDDSGMIHAGLAPHLRITGKMRVTDTKGKPSQTQWRVVERFRGASLIRCWPKTGRQHQIRVHLQLIGFPLLVDPLYGGAETFYLSSVKSKYKASQTHEERPLIDRLTLHAQRITFDHPITGTRTQLDAAYPRFCATLNQLRKLMSAE